ncbi:MAG TPA: NAD(P)H-binding protein [Tepidisphaeraceae bacterium]|nr:NAD(P)H-binding protein [Tepidisphaeraceae bacterium]
MPGRVFVTGGSGFVGSHILKELANRGFQANALVHRGSLPASGSVNVVQGDLFAPPVLDSGLRGCDAVIHLVGIIMEKPSKGVTFERIHFEGTRAVVDAAKRNGIRRYIQMSALGTRPNAVSTYHQTKWKAEEYLRASGLDWTILRPSLIHGPGGFMTMEAKWARKSAPPFLVMPYFGKGLLGTGGAGLLQPVFVDDVSRAFVDAIENPSTIHKTYDLAGSDRLTWPELHHLTARAVVGHSRLAAPLPAWLAKALANVGLGPLLGFSRDQVIMSQENNTGDTEPFICDFGWTPRGFDQSLREYASHL